MREMGDAASVPIEPIEQANLLDICVSQAGVIAGGVPGGIVFICTSNLSIHR
jgi:phosphomevalonate kinase